MKPYSKEFRGQVLAACERGRSTREVATYFDVSESWVRRNRQERREFNKTALLLKRRRIPLWAAFADQMRELIQQKPDLTLRELEAELHTDLSVQTLCTALRTTGLTAPLVVDGAINGEIFLGWVTTHLVSTLQPGDIVVMDNLGAHKVAGVREAIESAGARLVYLAPYSPDLNPIDLVFSMFKRLLKSASARTVDALWKLCGELLDHFTEAECRNCFRHCSYRYTSARCALAAETQKKPNARARWPRTPRQAAQAA